MYTVGKIESVECFLSITLKWGITIKSYHTAAISSHFCNMKLHF